MVEIDAVASNFALPVDFNIARESMKLYYKTNEH